MSRASVLVITFLSSVALADEPVKYELDGMQLEVPHAIAYATGKATLDRTSEPALAYVKGYLDAKSYISALRIEVHADSSGDAATAQKLTEQRALAVAKALVAKGVDCKRLVPVGFGATKPIADNKTSEGKAQNRRTAFFNAALRGRPIGGMPIDGGGVFAGDPCK